MLFYVLVIAILNMSLGFAVAVYLNRRTCQVPVPQFGFPPVPPATAPMGPAPVSESPPTSASEKESAGLAADPARGLAETPSPLTVDADPGPAPIAEPAPSETPPCAEKPGEEPIETLRSHVQQYHSLLAGLDDRLRQFTDEAEKEDIALCLNALKEANEGYQGSQGSVSAVLEQLDPERQEHRAVRGSLQEAAERHAKQMVSTNEAIAGFDFEADLRQGCRQISDETGKLMDVNDQLRDTLDEAQVAVARHENRLETVEAADRSDPLTGLASRACLEMALSQWWANDPGHVRRLAAGMIDVDRLSHVNQQYGHKVGDRILQAVGHLVAGETRDCLVVGRFSGQQFLLLCGDSDVRATTNIVERIRQLVELAQFQFGEENIRITASCAVTEVCADDTPETFRSRTEATLQEAKRYGRNRTFLHEGEYPTPVVPPNFSLETRSITI